LRQTGAAFSVSHTVIYRISTGKNWWWVSNRERASNPSDGYQTPADQRARRIAQAAIEEVGVTVSLTTPWPRFADPPALAERYLPSDSKKDFAHCSGEGFSAVM
jgi:hypothetical protein